jgi:hypothetical protein
LIALIINTHPKIDELHSNINACFFLLRAAEPLESKRAQVGQRPVAPKRQAPTLRPDFHRD